jgi:hypothetical protein
MTRTETGQFLCLLLFSVLLTVTAAFMKLILQRYLYSIPCLGPDLCSQQCCGSGMFYPGSGSDHCSIPDPGDKNHRIPDPTYFCIKAINKFYLLIPDPDQTIAPSRIPDPGGKKAPDPDPHHWFTRTRNYPYSTRIVSDPDY